MRRRCVAWPLFFATPSTAGLLARAPAKPYHRGMAFWNPQLLAQAPAVPIPVSTDWVPALLLTIVWIFVAAAIGGPIVRYLRRAR
jgi:hypothetical protein